jgi:RNA polymerase sigma-70 factor (ECF subfamily)
MVHPRAARLPDPDADVLVLVERRELAAAVTLLMRRHGSAIYRFCRELLHDAALAEDAQQQVFLEAFRDLERFSRKSSLRTWLFGIARHRMLDCAKQRRRREARERRVAAEDREPAPPPTALLDGERLEAALGACLRELDVDLQHVLLLRFQQGFTYEEMAGICREKATTLHARVTRALPILKAKIERYLARRR